jgi:hypothetical protein
VMLDVLRDGLLEIRQVLVHVEVAAHSTFVSHGRHRLCPRKPRSPSPRPGWSRPLRAAASLPRPEVDRATGENRRRASQPNGRAGGARHGGGREA